MTIALLFSAASAFALDQGTLFSNARQRGMGGIGVGIANDEHALFTNAAGLAGIEHRRWKVVSINLEGSLDLYDSYASSAALFSNFSIEKLNALAGKNIYFRGGAGTMFYGPGFALAAYIDGQSAIYTQNQVTPEYELGIMTTEGLQGGFAWKIPIGGKKSTTELRVGTAAKFMFRKGGYYKLGASDLLSITDGKEYLTALVGDYGAGVGFDLGTQLVQKVGKGTSIFLGTSATDIPKTNIKGKAQDVAMNFGLGLGVVQKMEFMDVTVGADLQNLTQVDAFSNKFHFGLELGVPFLKLWGGLNQGYFTYGMGVEFWLARISFSSYSEELGYRFKQRQNKRVLLQIDVKLPI